MSNLPSLQKPLNSEFVFFSQNLFFLTFVLKGSSAMVNFFGMFLGMHPLNSILFAHSLCFAYVNFSYMVKPDRRKKKKKQIKRGD